MGLILFILQFVILSHAEQTRIELLFGPEEEFRNPAVQKGLMKNLGTHAPRTLWKHRKNLSINPLIQHTKPIELWEEFFKLQDVISNRWLESPFGEDFTQSYTPNQTPILNLNFLDENNKPRSIGLKIDHAVLEVVSSPIKIKDLDGRMGKAYQWVFDTLRQLKWSPARIMGAGHAHVDLESAFRTPDGSYDLQRFRNLIVDWQNHSELYYGALHYDPKPLGARPFIQTKTDLKNWTGIIKKWDKLILKNGPRLGTRSEFLHVIEPFTQISYAKENFLRLNSDLKTLEIRSLRAKGSVDETRRIYQLLESRLNFIAKQTTLLPFHGGRAPQSTQQAVDWFYRYVTESNENYDEMKKILPTSWRWKTPNTNLREKDFKASSAKKPSKAYRCMTWILSNLLFTP